MALIHEKSFSSSSITLDAANELLQHALNEGKKLGVALSVAIVDAGGHLKVFGRLDNAPLLTVDMATNKAWTASAFGQPTHAWNQWISDPQLAPVVQTPRLVAVGGGYPIIFNGQVIGGIGISGGSYIEDRNIAEAALKEAGFALLQE